MPQTRTTPRPTREFRRHEVTGDSSALPGSVPWLIAKAGELEQDRNQVQEAIDENRKGLRGLAKQGALNDAERAWLSDFYPLKSNEDHRDDVDTESTRQAKIAARKGKLDTTS